MKTCRRLLLPVALIFCGLSAAAQAADPGPVPTTQERIDLILSGSSTAAGYIVLLEAPPLARYRGGIDGLAPTNPGALGVPKLDVTTAASQAYLDYLVTEQLDFLTAVDNALGRDVAVMAGYRVTLNGVALWLAKSEAPTVEALPGVKSIEEERIQRLTTDAGPTWIGAPTIWNGTSTGGDPGTRGEGIVTGIIDSGVNSDHPSFAEVGPVDGYVHVNPLADGNPLTPDYLGNCDGTTGLPYCNDKLIGAYDCTTSAGSGGLSQPPGGVITAAAAEPTPTPNAPVTSPFSGTIDPTPGACGPLHTVAVPAGQTSVSAAATADNLANDIFVDLFYDDPVAGQVNVAHGDTGTSPEVATYTPPGGVPAGDYSAQVCFFDPPPAAILPPHTYTGTLTYDDTPLPGTPGVPVLGCKGGASPEDFNGHGSHTASTTAGNVVDATVVAPTITLTRQISGVAPHANLITYLGCVPTGNCLPTNTNAAIEQATIDAVDVINYSIGGPTGNPWNDSGSQAFLSARDAGVYVATSAGNSGPGPGTIGSPADAPWLTAVAAATHDRAFVNSVIDMNGGSSSAPADILGKSITSGLEERPIIYAGDVPSALTSTPELCAVGDIMASTSPWPPGTFNGEIVVCDRGTFARVDKCRNAGDSGAGGCILANDEPNGNSLVADAYAIPGVHISFADGVVLKAWLADGAPMGSHMGAIEGSMAVTAPINGDILAGFSSRGENVSVPDIIKPDVANPGVDILAAVHSPMPGVGDPEFGFISGTSMSSPHTAGSLALIRALHPDWTPAEAQSAIMSTGVTNMLKEDGSTPADPFDFGGGRVDLTVAARAGLLFDEQEPDYTDANPANAGDPKTLNLASLADNACDSICSWTRTVTGAAGGGVSWTASFTSDRPNMTATVTPSSFSVPAGGTQALTIEVDVSGQGQSNDEGWIFGRVDLTPSNASLPVTHLPVAVINIGDADDDGLIDRQDNCTLVNNPAQCDTNEDGYGNHCDADLNNDGGVTQPDLGIFRSQFNMTGNDLDADLDCSGGVTQTDLGIFRSLFNKPPGPSGEAG